MRNSRDRIICIICTLMMVLSLSATVFAVDENGQQEIAQQETCNEEKALIEDETQEAAEEEPAVHVHEWTSWKTIKKATYYSTGLKNRTCLAADCDASETKKIPKLELKSVWIKRDGMYYYYNSEGNKIHGWRCIRGMAKESPKKWYYFNDKGAAVKSVRATTKNTWVRADGKLYYFTALCKPVRAGIPYYNYRYGTYALIDISSQRLYLYKDKTRVMTAPVITGMKGTHDTPTGTFSVIVKTHGTWLVGSSWCSYVDYWLQFRSGGYGIHDAQWRTSAEFSDHRRYIRNGSHGCVNMRHADARKVFCTLKKGNKVIIRK